MDICTIIAKNYLAHARVLARSYAEFHPDARTWVLVIDETEGYLDDPAGEPFELLTPADCGVEHFERMAALYTVLELSTAVKPWLLRTLLARPELDRVAYVDPDIEFHGSMEGVDRLLDHHHVIVTPHITDPMPRDDARPSETELLMSGSFNLGFIGLHEGGDTERLLDWWAERLETDCIIAPEKGYFVDQRWMDFSPGLVESFYVLRDPGYNVAYWNLPSRELRRRGDRITVNGSPLRFMHFSGYDPDARTQLSKHQDRVLALEGTVLRRLADRYGDRLQAAGYDDVKSWPYTWGSLPGGIELDAGMRQAFRDAVLAGAVERSVFDEEGKREFLAWANGPAEVGARAGVTRYLHAYWQTRHDLREDFVYLDGIDGPRLVAWADVYGRGVIPDPLLPSNAQERRQEAYPLSTGVNMAGYFKAVLGVGEHARLIASALEAVGVPIAPVGLRAEASPESESFRAGDLEATLYPVNLVSVNADVLPEFAHDAGPGFFIGRYTIGLWAWEVTPFPERYLEAFDHVDEVWVLSEHVAKALRPLAPVPVLTVPLPIQVHAFEALSRRQLGVPEGFLFLFCFDHNSVTERKNPLGLIDAFTRAFDPGAGASLVVKTLNGEGHPEEHRRLLEAAAAHSHVQVIDGAWPRERKDALMASCDCYVSLHRAEGFGITMAEAMWLGKPVVATGYSGNLEYMGPDTAFLVDHRLVPIGEGRDPYPAEGEWADPDLDHAARLMREVFDRPEAAHERALRGQAELRARRSPAAAGVELGRRLTRVQAWTGTGSAGPRARRPRIADTRRVAARIREGPGPANPHRFARAREAARRGLLRLLRPYTAHQQMVDNEILSAIHTLDGGLQSLAQSTSQLERLLAEVRAAPGPGFPLRPDPTAGVVAGYSEGDADQAPATVDDVLKGSAAAERARLGALVAVIGHREPVLDLNPGRGELLDLLGEEGRACEGVSGDPLDALENRAEGVLGAVVGVGLVGRLSGPDLSRLFALAHRALRPGGVLVLETANPHALAGLKLFWADPASRRPLFPETALALGREAGFPSAYVFHPGGTGNVEADRSQERTYAVVAERSH
jgi:glycosyltransferase involved in cell wall biosynthesis